VPDLDAARILRARLRRRNLEIIGLGDLAVGIRGDGDLAAAVLRILREIVEAADVIERNADDRRARRRELLLVDGEGMRLRIATARERRGIEVPFLSASFSE